MTPPMLRLRSLLILATLSQVSSLRPASLDLLLQARLQNPDPVKLQGWLRARPFAAVLPIQPMLVQPLQPPQNGVSVTFRRKPSSEKGGQDGGLRIAVARDEGDETAGVLLVTRISEGQFTSKVFSEKALCRSLVRDLESLPADCGKVLGVVDFMQGPSEAPGDTQ